MAVIQGMKTVNCGTLRHVNSMDIEVLGKGYSSHPTNMVVYYWPENGTKVEAVYGRYDWEGCGEAFAGKEFLTIYKFHNAADLHHYWSRNYVFNDFPQVPEKYRSIMHNLRVAYDEVFKNRERV